MPPLITVVIPTCHRNEALAECLTRLAPGNQTLSGENYHVIVTDDGSRSTAEQMIAGKFPWCRWTQGPRRGPAANRNHGAAQVQTEWIVFSDDDCLPQPGLLQAYAEAFAANPKVNVFEGRTSADGIQFHPLASAPINEDGGCLWSCNFAIRRSLFAALNGFDERFPFAAMEDSDFHLRLKQRHESVLFVRGAQILHGWRMGDLKAHWRRHLKSQMIFLRIHPEEIHRFSVTSYWKGIARYYVKSFFWSCRHYGWGVTFRHQPLSWWGFIYTSYVFIARPDPSKMKA